VTDLDVLLWEVGMVLAALTFIFRKVFSRNYHGESRPQKDYVENSRVHVASGEKTSPTMRLFTGFTEPFLFSEPPTSFPTSSIPSTRCQPLLSCALRNMNRGSMLPDSALSATLADSPASFGALPAFCAAPANKPSQLMKQSDFERPRRRGEYLREYHGRPCNAPRRS